MSNTGGADSGGAGVASGGSSAAGATGGSGMVSTGGESATTTGGTFGTETGGSGGTATTKPYEPRTGPFKMLAYAVTKAYRHSSILAGLTMLQDIGKEQGFEVTVVDNPTTNPNEDEITADKLARYEIVFFMNTTGDVFNDAQQTAFEDWITTKNGAFAGVHSAADTEAGWPFYKELTGQYFDRQEPCCPKANVEWQPDALSFVAVKGLPSPWPRMEEWYVLTQYQEWSQKPGFKILGMVTTPAQGTRPVSYIREWSNFRSFYTSLGHESASYLDAAFKRHVAAGILWAVRREALFKDN